MWLFVGRIVAGITGASITTASAYIADVSTPENRAKNFGMIGAAFGLGFVFGPAIGGLLTEYSYTFSTEPFFNTSFASYIVAALCFVTFVFGFFFLFKF